MKRLLWMLAVTGATAAVAGPALAQTNAGVIRAAWNSCDVPTPVIDAATDVTPTLVISITGNDIPNIGHDMTLYFGSGGAFPDAWRMDDLGCQTGSQISILRSGFTKTCPPFQGTNPFPITFFGFDAATNRAGLRLLNTYDTFTPAIGTRYTMWQVTFDHSFSVNGAGTPGLTCGGMEVPMCIAFGVGDLDRPQVLGADAQKYFPQVENTHVSWNSEAVGCPGIVPTVPSTWGRVKGLYR